jgi:hypothetical protein
MWILPGRVLYNTLRGQSPTSRDPVCCPLPANVYLIDPRDTLLCSQNPLSGVHFKPKISIPYPPTLCPF